MMPLRRSGCAAARSSGCTRRFGRPRPEYDDGVIDGRRLVARKERVTEKLDAIELRQMDQERLQVFDGLPVGTHEVAQRVRALSPNRLRAVIDVLVVFGAAPVGKGGKVFNPDRVSAVWKRARSTRTSS